MRVPISAFLLTALLGSAAAGDEPQAAPTPSATDASAQVARLIADGTKLHDRGDYDGAIATYRKALAVDPGNPQALYEIAYSQYQKKDLKGALATAEEAGRAALQPKMLAVLVGNIQDDLGEPGKAIAAYRKGLVADPAFFLLYFNLGTTYVRSGQLDLARIAFENAVALEPRHPGSHFGLARVYKEQGYRVPAILAATRFLVLESGTPRAAQAAQWIDDLFRLGVEEKSKTETSITIDPDAPKDEGDFTATDVMVPMLQASQKTIQQAGGTLDGPPEMSRLAQLLAVVGEFGEKDPGNGFAMEYYVPFNVALVRKDATAALAAIALRGNRSKEIEAWTSGHRKAIEDAVSVINGFKWSTARPALPADPPSSPAPAAPPTRHPAGA